MEGAGGGGGGGGGLDDEVKPGHDESVVSPAVNSTHSFSDLDILSVLRASDYEVNKMPVL